jgi:hypothetical protein
MGGWRKLHNEELPDLYSSPSVIGIIKSRRMRYVRSNTVIVRRVDLGTSLAFQIKKLCCCIDFAMVNVNFPASKIGALQMGLRM